MEIQNKMEQ